MPRTLLVAADGAALGLTAHFQLPCREAPGVRPVLVRPRGRPVTVEFELHLHLGRPEQNPAYGAQLAGAEAAQDPIRLLLRQFPAVNRVTNLFGERPISVHALDRTSTEGWRIGDADG